MANCKPYVGVYERLTCTFMKSNIPAYLYNRIRDEYMVSSYNKRRLAFAACIAQADHLDEIAEKSNFQFKIQNRVKTDFENPKIKTFRKRFTKSSKQIIFKNQNLYSNNWISL